MKAEITERIEQVRRGEVLEGYITQFGISPVEWTRFPLLRICQKCSLKNKNKQVDVVLSNSAVHGIVFQRDYFDKDIANEDNTEGYPVVEPGDFVYNPRISSMAPYGPININELGITGIVSPLYTVFRQRDKQKPQANYLKYFFATAQWHEYVYSVSNQGVRFDRMNITDEDFLKMPVPIPPGAEQQKIAEILAHCDKAIKLKKQLIGEKRLQKKWLMQNLLNPGSGIRLPGFEGKWIEHQLAVLGKFLKGTGISSADCSIGVFPCIKYGDIYMSYDAWFDKPVSHTEDTIAKTSPIVSSGALLFTGSGEDRMEIGKCTTYLGTEPLAVGGDIIIMQPNPKKANSLFLSYQQSTELLIKQKARLAQGHSIVHLYGEHIKALQVFIPPTMEEQRAIANVLLSADREINLLEQGLKQWQAKKKSLMQLLLTGLVRVTV